MKLLCFMLAFCLLFIFCSIISYDLWRLSAWSFVWQIWASNYIIEYTCVCVCVSSCIKTTCKYLFINFHICLINLPFYPLARLFSLICITSPPAIMCFSFLGGRRRDILQRYEQWGYRPNQEPPHYAILLSPPPS